MSSAAAVAVPEQPTKRLDYRAKISPKPQFYLFSPADVRLEAMVNAEILTFPKTDEIACDIHKTVAERCEGKRHVRHCPWHDAPSQAIPGVLPVREQPGSIDPRTGRTVRAMTAEQIVKELIGEDGTMGKLGKRGVRILFGDERDDLARQDSQVAWRESKYYQSLALKHSHLSINEKLKDADLPGLPPSKAVMEAMRYVAKYEADFNPEARYACPECQWPFEEKDARDAHIVAQHKDKCSAYGLMPFQALHPGEDDPENEQVAKRDKKRAEMEKIDRQYAKAAAAETGGPTQDLLAAMQTQIVALTTQLSQLQGGKRKRRGAAKARAKASTKEA